MEYKLVFYDCEVFCEDWLFCFIDYKTRKRLTIINDKDKLRLFYNKCYENKIILAGFNSRQYDQYILKGILLNQNPYRISKELIEQNKKGWQVVRNHKTIPIYNYDVMTGFNGLKTLEAFLGMNIKESDVDFNIDRKLTQEEIDETINYCYHDVEATIEVFEKSKEEFDSFIGLIELFDLDLENINKTKAQISSVILGANRPEENRNDEWSITLPTNLIIEKYTDVLEWFMSDEIMKPKAKYEREVYGVKHIFALGGIHGATSKQIYNGLIGLWDVVSLYPSTIIEYGLMSRNVPNPEKYKEIRDLRIRYKHEKNPMQAPLKIVLNATYGTMGDVYSQMYDPRQAHMICIYNQLFLLDLIEKIELCCGENAELIQSNTDGVYFQFEDEEAMNRAKECVSEWEKRTRYTMELDVAKKIIQRDVNNYILVMENGKVKSKGAVVKKLSPLDYDLPIVNIAVKEYLVNGVPLKETIYNEKELLKFQKIYKVGSNYKYAFHNNKPIPHKVQRCFASTMEDDTPIYKWKKDKDKPDLFAGSPNHVFIENGDIRGKSTDDYPLDKDWYIERCISEIKKFTGEVLRNEE